MNKGFRLEKKWSEPTGPFPPVPFIPGCFPRRAMKMSHGIKSNFSLNSRRTTFSGIMSPLSVTLINQLKGPKEVC